jgi:predicted Zn-dependent protease
MKTKLFILLAITVIFIGSFISCQTVAAVVSAGAQAAGATGVIDQNTADAISVSTKAIGTAAETITPEQEYYIGRAVAANILSTYRVWNGNPALTTYLNLICSAITVNSPKPDVFNGYKVAMLDTNEINAFATSGGHIFITRGLVNAAKSEDEIAAVIAHEVAHIQLQHSIKAIRSSRITQALMITGTAATGAATGMNVNELTNVFNESVGEIVLTLVNNGYSRDQEYEADNNALSLLASAGYNPSALINMLRQLNTVQSSVPGGFNRTHPTPANRITNAERTVGRHRVADNSAFRETRFTASMR